MKAYKQLLSLLTGLSILGTLPLTSLAAPTLSDIDGSYAKDAIQELVEAGILNGRGDGSFDPTGNISRQDFAVILAKALNLDTSQTPATATFTDVPADHYAFRYVEAAVQAGLIAGMGDGSFGTGNNLSRQDMAVLFVRALGTSGGSPAVPTTPLQFSDASQIAPYAKDAVARALELGLISGNTDGTFNPTGSAQRQAVAEVARKFLEKTDRDPSVSPSPSSSSTPQTGGSTGTPTTEGRSGGSTGGGGRDSDKENQEDRNHAPTVENAIDDVSMTVGDADMTVSLAGVFADEDGDSLSFTVSSSDRTILDTTLSRNLITLYPKAEGKATVQVKARDGQGGEVTTTFEVIIRAAVIPNHPPVVQNQLADQTLEKGRSTVTIDLSDVFFDEDADPLTYTAVSSDSGKTTVAVVGNRLELTPVSEGSATITVFADDGKNGNVATRFQVTVQSPPPPPPPPPVNHPPVVINPVSDQTATAGESPILLQLHNAFSDADGDVLTISVVSSNPEVASVQDRGYGLVELTPLQEGSAHITVTARDGRGGRASFIFEVTVEAEVPVNHDPTIANQISAQEVLLGSSVQVDLTGAFEDEDGDTLHIEVSTDDSAIATASVESGWLTIDPVEAGTTTLTLTATDGKGGSVSMDIEVTVIGSSAQG